MAYDNQSAAVAPDAPSGPRCQACGLIGRYKKDCTFRDYRCYNCELRGHIAQACPNTAIKDGQGRVRQRVIRQPSRDVVESRKDYLPSQRLQTASGTIQEMVQTNQQRSGRAKDRRFESKIRADPNFQPIPKRPVPILPSVPVIPAADVQAFLNQYVTSLPSWSDDDLSESAL
eukprot:GHVH01014321.1.p1 GENE.GHVH01014321.1~~GHVH01014321.1.p1  ORF type:complete len:173 (+),score=10.14 GHVH01014321.1:158-676(+)